MIVRKKIKFKRSNLMENLNMMSFICNCIFYTILGMLFVTYMYPNPLILVALLVTITIVLASINYYKKTDKLPPKIYIQSASFMYGSIIMLTIMLIKDIL